MPESSRLLKRTRIREVEGVLDIEPNVVHAGDDLVDVARQAFGRPSTRVLSVVDEEERLVGVLPVLRVVEEIVSRVAPEQLLADIRTVEQAGRFAEEVTARTAGQLMLPAVFLRIEGTVSDAFTAMHVHHLSGLPVVDEDRRVIGYVDVLELALRYLEQLEEAADASRDEAPDTTRQVAPEVGRDETPDTSRDETPDTSRDETTDTARNESPDTARDETPDTARDEAPPDASHE